MQLGRLIFHIVIKASPKLALAGRLAGRLAGSNHTILQATVGQSKIERERPKKTKRE